VSAAGEVRRVADGFARQLQELLSSAGLTVVEVAVAAEIPGSYWGGSEAGLVGSRLYLRADTPVHSALHEACHFICMDEKRRNSLERDAGGDYDEENAVCYLQILLADELPGFGRRLMCQDMDTWGYTFRLGSAQAWFDGDAADARDWLQRRGLIDATGAPSFMHALVETDLSR
jgi:hypothetical protein